MVAAAPARRARRETGEREAEEEVVVDVVVVGEAPSTFDDAAAALALEAEMATNCLALPEDPKEYAGAAPRLLRAAVFIESGVSWL